MLSVSLNNNVKINQTYLITMKKNVLKAGVLFLLVLVSCNSDDDNSSVNNSDISDIVNTAKSGTWRITSFIENDTNDETDNFTGYVFTFGDNDVLTAVKGDITQTGSWSVTDSSNSSDDDSNSDLDFNIGFSSPQEFIDLSDDWDIVQVSIDKITLTDVSGGDDDTDTLIFEKN